MSDDLLAAQAIVRVMMHMSGDQILHADTLARDVNYLISFAGRVIGIKLDVQTARVLDLLALSVPRRVS